MILTEQNINYISKNLELYGIKNPNLREDILDHICTQIENSEEDSFDKAYQSAIKLFGGYTNICSIQTETNSQLYYKSTKNRNKLLYLIGFLNSILITVGVLFKIMQWPYAGKILVSGFILLIIMTLPLYFYSKYKDKLLQYSVLK